MSEGEVLGFKALYFYLLIFARLIGVATQAPIFASPHMPTPAKIGFVATIALVMYYFLPIPYDNIYLDVTWFIYEAIKQFFIGVVIGFVSIMIFHAIQTGGELVDTQLGLSTGSTFDPMLGMVNINRRFFFYFAFTIFIVSGGFHYILLAIKRSFELIPVTSPIVFGKEAASIIINFTNLFFYIGLHIILPIFISVFIAQVAMGLVAKVAPQANVFVLSFGINFLVGVVVMSFSIPIIYEALVKHYLSYDYYVGWLGKIIRAMAGN